MNRQMFRQAALDHRSASEREGDILRLETAWTTWTIRLVLLTALAALVFIIVFDVSEYATGSAIVRVEGRRPLVTVVGGIVETVHVQPGQHVEKDQLLVTMSAAMEEAELKRATAEFQLGLGALLRDPADANAKAQLGSLKPRRDSAAQIANARKIRAPQAGVVTDIRVRPGQFLSANEVVVGVAPEGARASLVCVMPGEYRPMMKAGQPLRFSLTGYKFEYRTIQVDSVGEEVIGPTEMRRYLGAELGDAIDLHGPSVLVKAPLPTRTFTADGQTFSYVEGLIGTADVQVRREPIIVVLVPALKSLRFRK